MTRFRRSPRPLGLAVDALREDLAPATALAAVQTVWPVIVGPAIASEAVPTAERGGVLTITCSASVWAQELDLMSTQILERLAERLPALRLTRLRCVAA